MGDGDTPPPRPTRPLNYVVTEFLDDSGPPKMPPRPNNGVPAADPPKRAPPPPIPSYRQHMDAKNEGAYMKVSPRKDSDSGDKKSTDKQPNVAPPPVSHDHTPVAPPRRKTISGRIPRSTESSPSAAKDEEVKQVDSEASSPTKGQSATESKQLVSSPSRPRAPLRPQQSLPGTLVASPTKSTPPRHSGNPRPQSQVFQRDPSPRARASTLARERPSSQQQAEGQGMTARKWRLANQIDVFSNFFKRKTTKKARPVITVVQARPLDSEATPSPTKTPPTSLPPTQLHDDPKSPSNEVAKKPDRPVRAQAPSRPHPSTEGTATSAVDTGKPDLSAGTQVKDDTPIVLPRTQTASQPQSASNPNVAEESTASQIASEKQQPNQSVPAGEQGLQPSPVPKPRNRKSTKKASTLSDSPQDVVVDAAVKGESEKDDTQQPTRSRPAPPYRPRANTLDAKGTPDGTLKPEEPMIKAVAPPTPDAVGSTEQNVHAVEAPPQAAMKQKQPDRSETPSKAPPKPGPPGRPRPPAPVRQPTKGTVVESPISPGSGEAAKSIDASQCVTETDAIYAVPRKVVETDAEPTVVSEELENTPKDATVEKMQGNESQPPNQDSPKVEGPKVENLPTKVSSPKRKAPPKPAPPSRAKAPTTTTPLMKAAVEPKQEVSTVKEEGDAGLEKKATDLQADTLVAVPPPEAPKPELNEDKDVKKSASGSSEDSKTASLESPKKAPPKPPAPSRPRLPTLERKQEAAVSTRESSNDKDASQQPAADGVREAEGKVEDGFPKVATPADTSGEGTVKATPSNPAPTTHDDGEAMKGIDAALGTSDVNATYAVPMKPIRKEAKPAVAPEELENAPKDVAAAEKTPNRDSPKVEEPTKVSSPKRKAPPKPAPPSRAKAPTATTPLTKSLVETKQELSTVKEEGDAGSEKKATDLQADTLVAVPPAEAAKPELSEDKKVESSANVSKAGNNDQPSKGTETAVKESPKKQPPKAKPPPPSRPRLPTLEKKQEAVRDETSSKDKGTSQLEAAELQDGRKEPEANSEDAALMAEKTVMAAEVTDRTSKPAPPNKQDLPVQSRPSLESGLPGVQVASSSTQSNLDAEKKEIPTSVVADMSLVQPVVSGREDSVGGDNTLPVTTASTVVLTKEDPTPKMDSPTKVSSPKRKAPPKPAPPSRGKAPTPTSPLMKAAVETKQEVSTVKEEGDPSSGKTSDTPEAETHVTVLQPEAPEPTPIEDKEVQKSAIVGKEEAVGGQLSKSDDASQDTPKKGPSKPPPPSRPRLPTLDRKQESVIRPEESSVKDNDAAAMPPGGKELAESKTAEATPKEEKSVASAETMEAPKTEVISVQQPVAPMVVDSRKGLQQPGASAEACTEEASPGEEMTAPQKGVETVKQLGQESPKVEESSTKASSPKRKAPPKPAPPSRAKTPTPTTPLTRAIAETRQKASSLKRESGAGSEKKIPEQSSETGVTATASQLEEADVTSTSAAKQPEVSSTPMANEQAETHAHAEVTPEAQAKKKAPPKPGPPKRPAPAGPQMKEAKTPEATKSIPTGDGNSEVTSTSGPDGQPEALATSEAANLSVASVPEVIQTSELDTVTSPSSKKPPPKPCPPPKPGPPNKPKPPNIPKPPSLPVVEVAPGEQQDQEQEPAQDAPSQELKGSVGPIAITMEDTDPSVSESRTSAEREDTATIEPAEMSTKSEVEPSSPASPLTIDGGDDTAGEHPPPPRHNDVIATPTNPTSGDGGGGKPAKPPPPGGSRPPPPSGGSRPPPPSGDKRKPPPPKKPPPAKGPPPKPKQPGPPRRPGNVPPQLPPRPTLGHILYYYVTTEPRAVAKYNFTAQLPGELSFDEGDVLEIVSREDLDWFICRNVMDHIALPEGLVHQRHIKIVRKLPGETQSYGEGGPCAVAMSGFTAESLNELSLKSGDLVYLDSRVDPHWLRGHLENGVSGIFPKDVVEIVEDLPKGPMECELQPAAPAPSGPHCVVVFSFEEGGEGELTLRKGDVVELLERVGENWLMGRLAGKEGIFPSNFVNIIIDLPPGGRTGGGVDSPTMGPNMAAAVAEFKGMDGELSFKVGDHITVTGRVDADWLEGTLQGQKGIFPASFIDHVPAGLSQMGKEEKTPPPVQQQGGAGSKPGKTGKCKAIHKFETDIDGELPLSRGDIIITTSWINEEWLSGKVGDKEGIFPLSFVEILEELPRNNVEVSKHHHKVTLGDDLMPKAKVLYDFTPETDEEIPLKAGEIVLLLQKVDDAWYNGENSAGNFGNFPADYIAVIVPLP